MRVLQPILRLGIPHNNVWPVITVSKSYYFYESWANTRPPPEVRASSVQRHLRWDYNGVREKEFIRLLNKRPTWTLCKLSVVSWCAMNMFGLACGGGHLISFWHGRWHLDHFSFCFGLGHRNISPPENISSSKPCTMRSIMSPKKMSGEINMVYAGGERFFLPNQTHMSSNMGTPVELRFWRKPMLTALPLPLKTSRQSISWELMIPARIYLQEAVS